MCWCKTVFCNRAATVPATHGGLACQEGSLFEEEGKKVRVTDGFL